MKHDIVLILVLCSLILAGCMGTVPPLSEECQAEVDYLEDVMGILSRFGNSTSRMAESWAAYRDGYQSRNQTLSDILSERELARNLYYDELGMEKVPDERYREMHEAIREAVARYDNALKILYDGVYGGGSSRSYEYYANDHMEASNDALARAYSLMPEDAYCLQS